jgi:hypothetical protein
MTSVFYGNAPHFKSIGQHHDSWDKTKGWPALFMAHINSYFYYNILSKSVFFI